MEAGARHDSIRRRTFDLLEHVDRHARLPQVVAGALVTLILVNVVAAIFETVPSLELKYAELFRGIEAVSLAIFAAEYVIRLWASVEHPRARGRAPWRARLSYAVTPAAIVDLLAIAPFFVDVLTDVHLPEQCAPVAAAVDVLQIPAYLSRQTDLLLAAAATGKPINVKKGQFLAPWDMKNVARKIASAGNENILLCERGVSFGYNTLVSDMRALPIMKQIGCPVVFDATHSVQQPGGQGTSSGGQREFVPILARAAVAVGVGCVFMETHPDPDHAPSDGPNMVPLSEFEALVADLLEFDALAKRRRPNA